MRTPILLAAAILAVLPTTEGKAMAMSSPRVVAEPAADRVRNVALVRRFLDEVVNHGRLDLIDELWTPEMIWHGGSMGEVKGRAAYRRMVLAAVGGSFTDMHLDVKDVIADGDKVVVRFTNSGANTGPFMGQPASGKKAVWEGIGIYRIENGQIAEAWFSEDILGMFTQLGVGFAASH